MSTPSLGRGLLLALASSLLAAVAVIGTSVGPADAVATSGCLLGIICPPTTTAPHATTIPPTTAPPTTARAPATTAARATTRTTTRTTTSSGCRSSCQPNVGVSGLPVFGSVNLPSSATSVAPAPELAGSAVGPGTSTTMLTEALQPVLPNAVVPVGLPSDHRTERIALSLVALLVAVAALAQLPGSRRRPRPSGEAKAARRHVFPRRKPAR